MTRSVRAALCWESEPDQVEEGDHTVTGWQEGQQADLKCPKPSHVKGYP